MYVFNIGTTGTVHCVMLATMALYVRRSFFAFYRQDCRLAFARCSMFKVAGHVRIFFPKAHLNNYCKTAKNVYIKLKPK